MWGSGSRASYLPVNARQAPRSSHLVSWVAKHKVFVVLVVVAVVVSAQILLVGPVVMEMDSVKKLKADAMAWKPPDWLSHGPEPPSAWFPHRPEPVAAVPSDRLGPEVFPPVLSEDLQAASLYLDTNPHRGELPTYLEGILLQEPVSVPPPWPQDAPNVTADMWVSRVWNETSSTSALDAERAHLQPLEPEWRTAPWAGWTPPLSELAPSSRTKPLPKVQYNFQDPSKHSGKRSDAARDALVAHRQRLVRNAFLHAWKGYKKYAWGHDELKPVSKAAQDPFNGWGASIVDALDTLLVMGLPKEYDLARQHVRDIDFRLVGGGRSAYGHADGRIPVFETAIRYLGGFVSAYDLSGDVLMRDRAEELAQLIMPAFDTATGVPVGRIRLDDERDKPFAPPQTQGSTVLAEAGSLLLEFTRLWQVTGNRTYFDRVQRTTDWLDRNMTTGRIETLFPALLFPERAMSHGTVSFGGMADSYYEYLIKGYQLLGGRLSQYSRMYSDAIDGAKKLLITQVETVPGVNLTIIGQLSGVTYVAKQEHLACFTGGMLGLGSRILAERASDLEEAKGISGTCWWAYNSTLSGIGPEDLIFYTLQDADRFELVNSADGTSRRGKARGAPIVGVRSVHASYLNRPETIESVFYMWRITGDAVWQERGWQMFASWVTHCMTEAGFSAIYDVNQRHASWSDSMESFTFAETFKYYYLLFSPPELISLDEYVFTTEAHPLLAPKGGKWATAGQGSRKFWDAADTHLPPPGTYSGGERQQVGGLTNNQKHMVVEQWNTKHAPHVIRSLLNGLGSESIKTKLRSLVSRMETLTASLTGSAATETGAPAPSADPLEAIAGTRMYELTDGRLAVELDPAGDLTLQQAVFEQMGFRPSDTHLVLHLDASLAPDQTDEERTRQQHAVQLARMRSKGVL